MFTREGGRESTKMCEVRSGSLCSEYRYVYIYIYIYVYMESSMIGHSWLIRVFLRGEKTMIRQEGGRGSSSSLLSTRTRALTIFSRYDVL